MDDRIVGEVARNTDLMGLGYWLPGWRSSRGGGCSPGHLATQQMQEEHVTHDLGRAVRDAIS